ncbi:MAG: PaaI family thioesterase [Deltaproteobacteria bacterium]|nr:PaaI family thioesterase [Deltaproteobacteria bacterium]
MAAQAFQDRYEDDLSHCYGCGRLNEQGLQIKTVWEGEESVTRFTPRPWHIAVPGIVYGGLLASLIDCHGTATAAAAAARSRELPDSSLLPRFVTGSLKVSYLRPTPLGPELEIRGRVREVKGRKVVVDATVSVGGEVCVRGEVLAVEMPEALRPRSVPPSR